MSSCWHLNDTAWQSVRLKTLKRYRLMQGHSYSIKIFPKKVAVDISTCNGCSYFASIDDPSLGKAA